MHSTVYAAAFARGERDRREGVSAPWWLHVTESEEIHAGYMDGWRAAGEPSGRPGVVDLVDRVFRMA